VECRQSTGPKPCESGLSLKQKALTTDAPTMILQFPATDNTHGLALAGFRFFWAWYVTGFDPSRHCQGCLLGRRSVRVRKTTVEVGASILLDECADFDYLYVCGVSSTGRREDNFHLAVHQYEGGHTNADCYTGQQVVIRDSRRVEIPVLPDGFNGKSRAFTTCRNYHFGVAMYQCRDQAAPSVANADGTYGRAFASGAAIGHRERSRV
jgi:hypothetical protein